MINIAKEITLHSRNIINQLNHTNMNLFRLPIFATILITMILVSCKKDDEKPVSKISDNLKQEVKENYANLVFANYKTSYDKALKLQVALNKLLSNSTEATLSEAKKAWLDAREPYGQTEAFRFAGGPIDDEDGPEGLLNAWPLDESYIDYTASNANSGIVNDIKNFPTITKELLTSLNEKGGEENISIGYHAIEFLLWGQDLTKPSAKKSGQRKATDFKDGSSAKNQSRRRTYLKLTMELLLEHLALVKDEWDASKPNNYRSTFLAMDHNQAITHMLTGIGILAKSELAGERIFTAYDNKDQEDEHSCFSDNTHRDTRLNAYGVRNVYTGAYGAIKGKSIHDMVSEVDSELAKQVLAQLNKAVSAVDATAIPFDFAISNDASRPAVLTAVQELQNLGDKFTEAGQALGLKINTALPE